MRQGTVLCSGVLLLIGLLVGWVAVLSYMLSTSFPVTLQLGILLALIVLSFITARYTRASLAKLKADLLHGTQALDSSVINVSPDAIVVVDENLKIIAFNPAAEKLFGFENGEILGCSVADTIGINHNDQSFQQLLDQYQATNHLDANPIEQSLVTKTGETLTASTRLAVLGDESSPKYIFHIQDNSVLTEAESKLHYATFNDELTGLPNRHVAEQHITEGIKEAQRNNRILVVIKIGVDRLKHINESLGHQAGDTLLKQIAQRLKENIRRGDQVSRLNGDQFVVTLVDIDKETNLDYLIRKYVESFSLPFYIKDQLLHVSVSIGVACYPEDELTVDGLLRNAESAMFQAKKKGGIDYRYYSKEMREKSKERLYLENELRRAISKHELEVYYQPQVDLSTGKIIGVEALVRWFHPKLGMVSPVQFIPLAEEIGLISEIGEWVMKRACMDMTLMCKERNDALSLSINLSAYQFAEPNLVESIASILHDTGFPPEKLELEITESLFMEDLAITAEILTILSNQGIRISMDDFGTGYSSLSYLKQFPINTIKVDRSFVKDITSDKDNASIVKATIQMAHSLSLDIVAEGVETEDQLRFLLNQKCDKIQGFYFSKPLEFKDLAKLLEENRQIELNSDKLCLITGSG
ncbi:MAG TPA: phosphodiesterase [Gammaproteobacteria bacterium]|nr:phosphodiesterase [Gammaproteobacteria bacterium]